MDSEHFVLYPIYLDAKKTRKDGRKYPACSAVDSPKYQEVKGALDRLNIEYTAESAKCYPRDQTVLGRFTVRKKGKKSELVAAIVRSIAEDRDRKNSARGSAPNLLNLVPVRKKKGKKAGK